MNSFIFDIEFTPNMTGYPEVDADGFRCIDNFGMKRKGDDVQELTVHFSIPSLKAILATKIECSSDIEFKVIYDDVEYIYDADEEDWVEIDQVPFCSYTYLEKLTSFSYNDIDIVFNFPELTSYLKYMKILFSTNIEGWNYLLHEKIVDYFNNMLFVGRIALKAITTVDVGGDNYIEPEEFDVGGGYTDVAVKSVLKADGSDIFVVEDGNGIQVSEALTSQDLTVYYNYKANVMVNQVLDFVEISKYPTLILDNFDIVPSRDDGHYYAFGNSISGKKTPYEKAVLYRFNCIIVPSLYYDSLAILDVFNKATYVNIPITEINSRALLQMVSEVNETVFQTTEGSRIFYFRCYFTAPAPLDVEDVKLVTDFTLDSELLNGLDEEIGIYRREETPSISDWTIVNGQ